MKSILKNWPRTLLAIFILATLVRGVFVLTLQPGFYFPDSVLYSNAALSLITTGEFGAKYNRPPGYPSFLAAVYVVFGESIGAIRIVESLLGAFLAVIVALIGRRVGGDVVGTLSGVLWSVYPIAVFLAGLVYPTGLLTTLLAVIILCLLPYRRQPLPRKRIFLAGVLLGVATLTGPVVLFTIAAISLWILSWSRTNRFALVAFLCLGAAITIIPWTLRDLYIYKRAVAVEPRLLELLPYVGDSEEAAQNSKIAVILKHPDLFAEHFVGEFSHFWKLYPDRIAMDNPTYREWQHKRDNRVIKQTIFTTNNVIKIISILATAPLFLFALIGACAMWLEREQRRDLWLLLLTILSFAVGYSIFYAQLRYRIPIEPYITILSAYGVWKTWSVLTTHLASSTLSLKGRLQNLKQA